MTTVKVIRVEHRVRRTSSDTCRHFEGPYRNRDILPEFVEELMIALPRPESRWFDCDYDYVFAFRSKESLITWFTPTVMQALVKLGFVLSVYEVHADYVKLDRDNIQCCFHPEQAKRIQRKVWRGEETLFQLAA